MSLENKLSIRIWFMVVLIGLQMIVAIAQAQDNPKQILVVEVRKKLQMTSKDPVIRDYYVNSGTGVGLKAGAYVGVYRRLPLSDPNRDKAQTHVEVPVGVMRIIYADSSTSIGRIHTIRSVADTPILESDSFMVGDRLDMSTLGFERRASDETSKAPTTVEVKTEIKVESKAESKPEEKPALEPRSTASEPKITDKSAVKTLPPQAKSVEILTK